MQVETLLFYQLGEIKLEVHVFLVLVCVFLECKHNMNHDRFPLPEHIFHKKKVTKSKQPIASLRYQHLMIDHLHIYGVLKYTGSYRTTITHFQFFYMQSLCAALF